MKPTILLLASLLTVQLQTNLFAQENGQSLQELQNQLQELQQQFISHQRSFQEQMDLIQSQINTLQSSTSTEEIAAPASGPTDGQSLDDLEAELAQQLGFDESDSSSPTPSSLKGPEWSPSAPMTIARSGNAYMNVSFDAMFNVGYSTEPDVSGRLNLGDHDPSQRGFSMRNAELVLDGAVDPYFKGFANLVYKLDGENESEFEIEEVYLQTQNLPWNLQAKAGQFFAPFGRMNRQHPHSWAFADQSLVLNRAFGPEGLRNLGAELSWLAPTPFFAQLSLGVFNGEGATAWNFRNSGEEGGTHGRSTEESAISGFGDLLYVPRLEMSFDLSDTQTLVVGASGAFGPNSTAEDADTEIVGGDIYWKWKPVNAHRGFPFVSFQSEFLYSIYEAGADPTAVAPLPAETLEDWGLYSQLLWGFKPGWVAGLRGEWVDGNEGTYDSEDAFRNERIRVSPNLTWYPTEFSKLRLQYDYDELELGDSPEHSVWFQMEILLGAHAAHKF